MAARWTNVVLGVWLFISAFIWQHTEASFTSTWVVGVVITGVALIAMALPAVRYVNAAVAVYLFLAALFLPHVYLGSAWHNGILAVVVFFVSLIPTGATRRTGAGAPGLNRRVHA